MPLGFGRSILSKTAVAAGPTSESGYFQSSGTNSSGADGAGIVLDSGSSSGYNFNSGFTQSFWFKGTTSNLNNGTIATIARTTYPGDDGIIFNIRNIGIEILLQDGNNYYLTYYPGGTTFVDNYLDDDWHHIAMTMTKTASGRQMYLDGVDVADPTTGNSTATVVAGRYLGINFSPTSDSLSYADSNAGTLQLSQLWLHNQTVDLDSNLSKFYAGGFVDMGSSGTSSGLSQPLIYIRGQDGITNGGSVGTPYVVSEGSGQFTYSTSGGPVI
jgi:hypothetical protein